MIQLNKKRRKIKQICSSVKSNHRIVVYGKRNVKFTELRSDISYASSSKDVFSEQKYQLVVFKKKDRTITQSLLISFGGEYIGI